MKSASTLLNKSRKVGVLVSWAYLKLKREYKTLDWICNNPNFDVLVDSGAFTFHKEKRSVELEEYLEFLDEWGDKIWGYIALDVIGNPRKTRQNLETMWEKGYSPIPVHVFGADEKWMNYLYEHSPLICIASMPIDWHGTKTNWRLSDITRSYIKMVSSWSAGRPVHWLGYSDEGMIQTFRPYSCDCVTWKEATMYGIVNIYRGNGRFVSLRAGEHRKGQMNRSEFSKTFREHEKELVKLLARFGISADEFLDIDNWNTTTIKSPAFVISVYSWIQYIKEIEERFGTRFFLVMNSAGPESSLVSMIVGRCGGKAYPLLCNPDGSDLFVKPLSRITPRKRRRIRKQV